ncbi:PfkB family carbohydrate kinase [Bradyrhizobium sp. STM 3566]|uniref:PfkB family carbohydrate kinase n=1 Tax=Bradyrhizobium sp. STM 3566 TaxID=578928 RepID=UPI00388E86F3
MTRVDLTLKPAPRHPICVGAGFVAADIVEGRTEEFVAAGGSCGNVLAILAWLGWKSYPVARLGRDWAATVIRKEFESIGVEGDFLSDEKAVQTPIVIQRFVEDKAGKRVHRFSLACPECGGWLPRFRASTLQQATEVTESATAPKAFYMDRLSPAALKLAGWAKDNGALVVFEPSSIGDERQFQKAVDLCHILKFSHDRLGHMRDLLEAQQPKVIVETLAEEGLRVRWRGHWSELPAFKTPAFVDGAGAGDWTSAGLLHQLGTTGAKVFETLQKPRLLSALRFGQALAAVNCGYEGARGVMLAMTRDQLAKRLTALASRKTEASDSHQDAASHESDIPTRLCATCASDEKGAPKPKKAMSG